MTDKEQIRAEIERRRDNAMLGSYSAEKGVVFDEMDSLLTFIDSLPAESASSGLLEDAAEEYGVRQGVELKPYAVKFFKAGAEWQKEQDDELLTIAHFDGVQSGKEAERREMMKMAVEGRYMKTIDGECYVESSIFSPDGFVQVGGKVKLIILKDDE